MNILKRIESDTRDEFNEVRKDLKLHLGPDFDISQEKEFLKNYIPKEIVNKSEILLDTLINYLMDEAMKKMKEADVKLQNKFFEKDFRKRINDWAVHVGNRLEINPDVVKYSTDPRLKQGIISGGLSFFISFVLKKTVFIHSIAIVNWTIIILLPAIAIKITYNTVSIKSRKTVKSDVNRYLENAEPQVQEWLKSVIDAFSKDFNEFCLSNNFNIEAK